METDFLGAGAGRENNISSADTVKETDSVGPGGSGGVAKASSVWPSQVTLTSEAAKVESLNASVSTKVCRKATGRAA